MNRRFDKGPRPLVALIDPMCRSGYGPESLDRGGLGGTEATVIRVASALSERFVFTHFQHGRDSMAYSRMGRLCPLEGMKVPPEADALVVINSWKVAVKLRKAHPARPIFLWLHVYPGRHNRAMGPALHDAGIEVICVSQSHAAWLKTFLARGRQPRIRHVYNPVADNLVPDTTPRDRNRLLFASSPHKGLAETFEIFDALRQRLPDLALAVADPGYLGWETGPVPKNTVFLGKLPHQALLRQMRSALCLFYPQGTFAETFGLVMAEAQAVGTPVVVCDGLGANDEIIRDSDQRFASADVDAIARRIVAWQRDLPIVRANPLFRLRSVALRWSDVLCTAIVAQDDAEETQVA